MLYLDQDSLVADQLAVTRRYLDAAAGVLAGDAHALEREVDDRIAASLAQRVHLPVTWLRHRLGLTATEERLLWVLIAHELCPDARQQLRRLATEDAADASLDVLRRVVYGPNCELRTWRELAPDGPLRRRCLIERIDPAADAPAHRTTFRVARRVLALVHGALELDDELAGIAVRAGDAIALDELEVAHAARAAARLALARGTGAALLWGRPGSGRRSLWLAAAREANRELLVVDGRALARDRDAVTRQLRIIARECRLLGCAPLVLHLDALAGSADAPDRLEPFEAELGTGLVLATASAIVARRWRRPPAAIELPPLTGAGRAKLWRRALPMASAADAELLAMMYPLAPALIPAVGELAVRAAGAAEMRPHHVEAGLRAVLDDRLAGLAARIETTQTWDDLVLPEDQTTAIVELLARIRERRRVYEEWGFAAKLGRGLGVSALFSGPPGTGKTMCAGLIGRELGTELYQVDLSKVVSKWIGETEKNLAALFDAAEAGHAILLFDEADALFGKRTAVASSHDRHANQEVNYLLQRLERFAGICILTTNHELAIDDAFRRRLSMHVRFPMPAADERQQLWRAMLPARAPVEDELGFEELAQKYVMSGGYIRNAVLRAAFLAADDDSPITAALLAHAAQLEYEAMGKLAAAPRP